MSVKVYSTSLYSLYSLTKVIAFSTREQPVLDSGWNKHREITALRSVAW